jgi:tetratricopeptide (TPR) repeat protein
MSSSSIEKLCLKARQAIAQREWDKAKQAYLMALGHKSDLPDVHYGLATVYFQLRELTSAAHHFREVTRLDPLRAGAFINLGAVLNLLQEYDEAITALRRGIQIDANRVEATTTSAWSTSARGSSIWPFRPTARPFASTRA